MESALVQQYAMYQAENFSNTQSNCCLRKCNCCKLYIRFFHSKLDVPKVQSVYYSGYIQSTPKYASKWFRKYSVL